MKMTNNEIYTRATALAEAFQDGSQKLPIKVNFYLQKNKAALLALAQDIEKSRIEIAETYGTLDTETSQYVIPAEKMADAAKELEDLFKLEQEVQIYKINIDSLSDDLAMTTAQMEAIMFMID
jgi:predicted  nucleic acid-binding Zn-ribbon protein